MDYYQGWFDLKPGVKDTDFARSLARYMSFLKDRQLIEGWNHAASLDWGLQNWANSIW